MAQATTPATPSREQVLKDRVAAALASDPQVAVIAKQFAGLGQGEFIPALKALITAGTSRKVIVLGYAAGRAIEFAARPKYRVKDAAHVWADVQRHAANHYGMATASLYRASLPAAKVG